MFLKLTLWGHVLQSPLNNIIVYIGVNHVGSDFQDYVTVSVNYTIGHFFPAGLRIAVTDGNVTIVSSCAHGFTVTIAQPLRSEFN